MLNNKCDSNFHIKKDIKDEIISSCDDTKFATKLTFLHPLPFEPKNLTRKKECLFVESFEDMKAKSFLKMSLKLNGCVDKMDIKSRSPFDISKTNFKTSCCSSKLNFKPKTDEFDNSNICNSCKYNGIKTINCKSNDSEIQVSIKSKRPFSCKHTEKYREFNSDDGNKRDNNTISLENEKKILKLDSLFQFLNQMRHAVISQELSFEGFKSISARLLKDKMNMELLLLTELIVRAQVIQMVKLISKDLSQNKITPPILVSAFLKQYQLLKSLSNIYRMMLSEYESTYLHDHNLSFEMINRSYFKRIVQECPKIKEQLAAGNLTVKFEEMCNGSMSASERVRAKIDYVAMKSDFQDQPNWPDIDQTIGDIAGDRDKVVHSLITHSFSKDYRNAKGGCNELMTPTSGLYNDILGVVSRLPDRDSTHKCSQATTRHRYHGQNEFTIGPTCGSIYQALENIKPPSISCSSSSNNSNGYNSCVSISSYEDSSDEDRMEELILQNWRRESAATKNLRPPMKEQYDECRREIDCGEPRQESAATRNLRPPMKEQDHECRREIDFGDRTRKSVTIRNLRPPMKEQYHECRREIDCGEPRQESAATRNLRPPMKEQYDECRREIDCGEPRQEFAATRNLRLPMMEQDHECRREIDFGDRTRKSATIRNIRLPMMEQYHEFTGEIDFDECNRLTALDRERSNNHDEIKQFDKLYEQYLAENEHMTTNMSVPDCLSTLEKADNLQSIIKTLMARYRKNIDLQERLCHQPRGASVPDTDSGYTTYAKKEDLSTSSSRHDDDPIKDEDDDNDDFEMDFEELSQTLSAGATTRENLEEFEKFLEGKLDLNRAKSHPNVQQLVTNCRLHCNKLYKPLSKDDSKRYTDSESSDTGPYLRFRDIKTVTDDSVDLPLECSTAVNIDLDPHRSSSDTGSSSASTENNISSNGGGNNTNNNNNSNKVCNCCKCEMFGEQNYSPGNRALDAKEKLRNALERRRQCRQNISTTVPAVMEIVDQPDVDSLVDFINGSSDKTDCVTPELVVRSVQAKKPKHKTGKSKTKKTPSTVAPVTVTDPGKEKVNDLKETEIVAKITRSVDSCLVDDEVVDKEAYDPVVEDFKKFCSSVVVPKQRKKLLFCTAQLISDLEKR